jgi:NAD(P)-dependent dehydrogenase (short-subunit alcohol dehydrogenase family)
MISSGFGNMTTKQLDRLGARVFAGCLTEQGAKQLDSDTSDNVVTFLLDVTDEQSISNAVQLVKEQLKGEALWGVVNNAGIFAGFFIELTKVSAFKKVFDVNTFGMFRVTQAFAPLLRRGEQSRLVNITSVAGRISGPSLAQYSGSKHAGEALSDAARHELSRFGIKTVIVEPGFFRTHIVTSTNDQIQKAWDSASPDVKRAYGGDAFLQHLMMRANENVERSADPTKVVDTLVAALFSRFPAKRYTVGRDSLVFLILARLPAFFSDALIRSRAEFDPKAH